MARKKPFALKEDLRVKENVRAEGGPIALMEDRSR
jgi:hypothetical protein